jgi:uncharacterized protein YjeT (DUF2065 family)
MPTDFSALLDSVLVIAGLSLVVTGLVMFVRSKTSTQASSVEAFGIKLNVTHPSLILVLAGVGLMLAPRLLPEPPDKTDKPEAVVAEAAKPSVPAPATPPTPAPVAAPSLAPPPAPAIPAATMPPAQASAASARRAPPTKPQPTVPAAAKKPPARIVAALPAIAPPTASTPLATRPSAAAPAESVVTPPLAARSARPTLVYAALGLPISRSFWSGETRASYTGRMDATLQQAGREVLRMDTRKLELDPAEFNAWWNESSQHPRSRERCAAPQAPLALLTARVETPTTISSVESAYWPELTLRLFVCASQRIYRQQKTLAPHNEDAWPFSVELNGEIERFLRTYRSDLRD